MQTKPFFSVIIPTLNEEKYLPRLLNCLCHQTFKNFEIIVVDANSNDNTIRKVRKYQSFIPKLRLATSKIRNCRYQRNLGAKRATGEYLVLLEADVMVKSSYLREIHKTITEEKAVFLTTWQEPDSSLVLDRGISAVLNLAMEFARIIRQPFSGAFNTIVRKDIFYKMKGFNENLRMSDDHDFAIRVHKAGYKLEILRNPLLLYSMRRFHSEGRVSVLIKYVQAAIYLIFLGPKTAKLNCVDYPMGGHVHRNN